jgi:hypothetical protein
VAEKPRGDIHDSRRTSKEGKIFGQIHGQESGTVNNVVYVMAELEE